VVLALKPVTVKLLIQSKIGCPLEVPEYFDVEELKLHPDAGLLHTRQSRINLLRVNPVVLEVYGSRE